MDHLGLDAAYRARTACTLYTLELHMHYLHEVKRSDELSVATSVLDFDRKRIHAGCEFSCRRLDGAGGDGRGHAAARASGREARRAPPFPPEVERLLAGCSKLAAGGARGVRTRIAQDRTASAA